MGCYHIWLLQFNLRTVKSRIEIEKLRNTESKLSRVFLFTIHDWSLAFQFPKSKVSIILLSKIVVQCSVSRFQACDPLD